MHRINEPHATRAEGHHKRLGADPVAEKADAFQEAALRHACCGEDDLFSGSELRGGVNLFDVLDAHGDRKSTRLNSSHLVISYAVFCLKKKKTNKSINHI